MFTLTWSRSFSNVVLKFRGNNCEMETCNLSQIVLIVVRLKSSIIIYIFFQIKKKSALFLVCNIPWVIYQCFKMKNV